MHPIIFHTSKTMRPPKHRHHNTSTQPTLKLQAEIINRRLKDLSRSDLKRIMKISDKLALDTHQRIFNWQTASQYRAIEYFAGDIYTGLDVETLSDNDLDYAQRRLVILSGLYGILRPLDLIATYRLEMGYPVSIQGSKNLYDYWAGHLASALPQSDIYIHLSSEEYFKAIRPLIKPGAKVIAPIFLTKRNVDTKQVTIHSKVARGAYANWILKNRVENLGLLPEFNQLGYTYSDNLSTELNPTYIKRA